MRRTAGTIMNFLNSDKNLEGIIRINLNFCKLFCQFYLQMQFFFFTVCKRRCGKVMFSEACFKNSGHRGGRAWQGERMHGGRGACMGGMCGVGEGEGRMWQEIRPQ